MLHNEYLNDAYYDAILYDALSFATLAELQQM